ncbi:MAG: TetR/AcrR family transcriptional regulator [Myxococcota bacterium]
MVCLSEEGVEQVRVERLAKRLGVSKGSFYWHFDGRPALLDAVLDRWETVATTAIIEQVETLAGPPKDRLWTLMTITFRTSVEADRMEAALRAWAAADPPTRKTVRRVDRRRLRYVEGLLQEAGLAKPQARQRAHILYRTLVGEFVMRSSGEKPTSQRALRTLHTLLVSAPGSSGPEGRSDSRRTKD